MKALYKKEAKPGIWMKTDAPMPEVGPNDVLIKIKKTAICGTDIHIYNWDEWAQKNVPVGLITGHEYVGVIEKVGSEVTNFKAGERVSGEGHLVCGVCRNCRSGKMHLCVKTIGVGVNRQGAFAEFSRCRPQTLSAFLIISKMILPRFSTRAVTPRTPRLPSISSAKTC